jgi:hypothetical protein
LALFITAAKHIAAAADIERVVLQIVQLTVSLRIPRKENSHSTQREQPFHGKVNRDSTAK